MKSILAVVALMAAAAFAAPAFANTDTPVFPRYLSDPPTCSITSHPDNCVDRPIWVHVGSSGPDNDPCSPRNQRRDK